MGIDRDFDRLSNSARHRRLLDLLSGWAEVAEESDVLSTIEECDAIADLYQRVGAIEDFDGGDLAAALDEIRIILRTGSRG